MSSRTRSTTRIAYLRRWQARCYEAGFVGRAWPAEFGGGGRPTAEQIVVDQELAAAGAPGARRDRRARRARPRAARVRHRRAEAAATSARSSRRRRSGARASPSRRRAPTSPRCARTAVETDDGYVVSGQKTWVSWGQFARWCGVLARTDPDVPTHKGISLLIVDLESPGVEVRPMVQITGHAEFCELFLDDVLVPQENLLGGPARAGRSRCTSSRTSAARPRCRGR